MQMLQTSALNSSLNLKDYFPQAFLLEIKVFKIHFSYRRVTFEPFQIYFFACFKHSPTNSRYDLPLNSGA